MERYLSSDQFVLVTILVKLVVIASVAAVLVRYGTFKRLLFSDFKTWRDKGTLLLFLGIPIILSTAVRVLLGYKAADISLEGTLLGALIGGRIVGVVLGTCGNLPCLLNGELLAPPFGLVVGLAGGFLHVLSGRREDLWNFSPLFFLRSPSSIRQMFSARHLDRSLLIFFTAVTLELTRILAGMRLGHLFYLFSTRPTVIVAIFASTLVTVGISIKMFSSTRNEIKLKDQEALLMRARLEALISQIKPHFLFNTLNSIASAIRSDPDKARHLIFKLSHILRRLIDSRQEFVPLREEIELIDSYLDIEVARFGTEKLRVAKKIDSAVMDVMVPAMLLQPLVENAVGHGVSPKIEGGTIHLEAALRDGRLAIEVSDDGVGIPPSRLAVVFRDGVGINNTAERLKVIYGDDHTFDIESRPDHGTICRITIPQMLPSRVT